MMHVTYAKAVEAMAAGLAPYMDTGSAREFAEIFAGNSADGVHSHGMNRYPRYVGDIQKGLCDAGVTRAERMAGFGALERWDAHFGFGPLIARQMARRAAEMAREHGIGCVALANNSHWLRAGRYALEMAEAGMMGICMTNTCMNLVAYGAGVPSTGNNPIAMAVPHTGGPLLLDMAVSQYAFGKLEIMAQQGRMLDTACGYDRDGNETNDPQAIIDSGLMMPMALWKGSALSIMIDMMTASLSAGRYSHEIGAGAAQERGMSQIYIAINPAAVTDAADMDARIGKAIAFLDGLEAREGTGGVHAPGAGLYRRRAQAMEQGIAVTEATWKKILEIAQACR